MEVFSLYLVKILLKKIINNLLLKDYYIFMKILNKQIFKVFKISSILSS